MDTYIHYGGDKYDPDKFVRVKNDKDLNAKPFEGGLWGSPVKTKK